uniref:Uncharacterized protein n=1 Tax=Lepeophtheirus salmonis TaxID=72036 RepID=A0A0K2V848_LEPSM
MIIYININKKHIDNLCKVLGELIWNYLVPFKKSIVFNIGYQCTPYLSFIKCKYIFLAVGT